MGGGAFEYLAYKLDDLSVTYEMSLLKDMMDYVIRDGSFDNKELAYNATIILKELADKLEEVQKTFESIRLLSHYGQLTEIIEYKASLDRSEGDVHDILAVILKQRSDAPKNYDAARRKKIQLEPFE